MNWVNPRYEEIKMDAEIGSYQVDPDVPERGGEYSAATRIVDAPTAPGRAEAVHRAT
jgi:hypothetical protein